MRISIRNTSFQIEPFEHIHFWNSINEEEWERDTYDVIDEFVSENSIVLDVGSWAGPISLYAAANSNKVYALEPDPSIFPQLEHNVGLNPQLIKKLQCFKLALANTSGKRVLYARKKYGQSSSSLLNRTLDNRSDQICNTTTLADFVSKNKIERLDFIKLDIEGGEFLLLPEISETLAQLNHPTFLISFHYSHLKELLLKQKVRYSLLAKLCMKIEKLFGLEFYKQSTSKIINDSLKALKAYAFVYSSNGKSITLDLLLRQPELIKKESFVFSNRKWSKD